MEGVKFYGTATVGSRGQIVIPAEAREDQGIKEGDKIIVVRGPHGGLDLFRSDQIEAIIQKIQKRSNQFLEVAQNIKDMAEKEDREHKNE